MKNRCAGLVVVLLSLSSFHVVYADIEFVGVLDHDATTTWIDSVSMTPPDTTFLTPGWGWDSLGTGIDTFVFAGVPSWPETIALHGNGQGFPLHQKIPHPQPDTWYPIGPTGMIWMSFYGDYGVEESKSAAEGQARLTVSPSVVTGQMTVRLQPVGAAIPVVEIHDAVGNLVRSLVCTAGTDGVAMAMWNREDDRGRLVPEGVYFCRYSASDVIAVGKVLVAR